MKKQYISKTTQINGSHYICYTILLLNDYTILIKEAERMMHRELYRELYDIWHDIVDIFYDHKTRPK